MKQMINKLTKYLLALCAVATVASCDSFLDRQEDETLTFEKIWQQVSTTKQYFFQAMSFLPNDSEIFYHSQKTMHCIGASDESTCTWNWNGYQSINFGSWNPANMPTDGYNYFYTGILECNIFLANVLLCSDPAAVKSELELWYYCARWARAYYYFMLMRDYGPVILVGDEQLNSSASLAELARPRNTWEECVNYVVSEMELCAKYLPEKKHTSGNMGLPTKGAALAVISRLKLYSARDLFNGNNLYRSVVNPDGTRLFPKEKNPQKWVEAAKAAKAVMDLKDAGYQLYRTDKPTGDPTQDAVLNYLGVTQKDWNDELIYCGGGFRGGYIMGVHVAPQVASGTAYGGWGPTQQQVDAYAMSNGRYPITGYERNGKPIIDEESGYNADEFGVTQKYVNPMMQAQGAAQQYYMVDTRNMYVNREPRFYVSVFFVGGYWMHSVNAMSGSDLVSFCLGANAHGSHDSPKSGYLVNRFYDHTLNSYGGNPQWGNITFPTFRLGEIYLNYIEAVLECERNGVSGEDVNHSLAMELWADLRDRSGLAPIEEVYPGASIEELIELVRKERRVELAFEGHRYYDTRTWMIATETDNGPMYGMDTSVSAQGTETAEGFWKRTIFERRIFKENHYLFPIPQRDINLNGQLVQNYGW